MSLILSIKSDSVLLTENNKDILEKYVCPKCDGILRDAVQTSCGHWLCNGCAEEIFNKKETTPYCPRTDCGEELTTEEGRPFFPDRFVRKEINHLSIMCRNRKFGCDWNGKIGELVEHLSSCAYEKEECPHCKEGFSLSEYQSHVDQCPKVMVTRPLKDHGCQETKQYQSHVNQCRRGNGTYVKSSCMSNVEQSSSCPIGQGSRSFGHSHANSLENHSYYTPFKTEEAPRQSQYCSGAGQGHCGEDLTDLSPNSSPVSSLIAKMSPLSELHLHECTFTCPLKGYGCQKTKEMSREECIEHVSSKNGIYSHVLVIASVLSSLVTTSSTDAKEVDRIHYAESDDGYDSMSKVLSASPTVATTYVSTDGPEPRGNEFGFLDDGVAGAVAGFGGMGGRADDKLMSLVTGIQAELTEKDSQIHTLQDKVAQLETTLSTKMSENEDRDFRLSLMENSNFDGSMVWKIPQFSQRMDDARTGKYTSIFSLPFYSSRYGYKMCLHLYILGDGIGKGTHMSLFFVVMKGEHDAILQWPFTHKVTFKLINQCGGHDVVDVLQPECDPLSSSFQKPKSDMNVASGCPRFVSIEELMQGGFVLGDTIFIKVKVDTTRIFHP